MTIKSNKVAHAVSSKFRGMKKLDKTGRSTKKLGDNSLSVNSIDVSLSKKKLPKEMGDYSFNFDEKNQEHSRSKHKIVFEDEQLSKIDELQNKHESIMSDRRGAEDTDSEAESEEK